MIQRHTCAKAVLVLALFLVQCRLVQAQFLMDMVDTSSAMGRGMLGIYKKFDKLSVTGYIQPQFQVVQSKGAKGYAGGDFNAMSDNRFMLRRGRIRFDYAHFNEKGYPQIHFVFQFDGTDKGVFARDFWGRLYDTKYNLFIFSAGIMPRPFSYELNMGSSERESPERARVSQILMKVERDLGAMVSFEPRNKLSPLYYLKIDVGVFNGPGLNTTVGDYDSYKDVIGRVMMKQKKIAGNLYASCAVNGFYGGLANGSNVQYTMAKTAGGDQVFVADSSPVKKGKEMPRRYASADVQLKYKYAWGGATEVRAEYWQGTQSAYASTSETPATLTTDPIYTRRFSAFLVYFLQHIVNRSHQVVLKFDWYDPNRDVKGSDIGKAGTNLTATDIRYTTLSGGYAYAVNDNVRLTLWYDRVMNERTNLPGYTSDLKDDVLTCRLQFRF